MKLEGDVVEFNGDKYRWDGKYYRPTRGTINGRKRLHATVWEFHNQRAIPKGYEIHHIDGDKRNNAISNLECLTKSEHRAKHAAETSERMKRKEQLDHLEKIRPMTKAWHKSPEGRRWHSVKAAKQIRDREPHSRTCGFCKQEFKTKSYKAIYCGLNCKASAYRRRIH